MTISESDNIQLSRIAACSRSNFDSTSIGFVRSAGRRAKVSGNSPTRTDFCLVFYIIMLWNYWTSKVVYGPIKKKYMPVRGEGKKVTIKNHHHLEY